MTSILVRIFNNVAWWLLAIWMAGYSALRPRTMQSPSAAITVGEVVAFVVIFVIIAGAGLLTARIAARKGGSYVGWSYYGLLLPYIALPHALLKRPRGDSAPVQRSE
jgi:hypothetical protein